MANKKRSDEELTEIYYKYRTMLYRVCFTYMKNNDDTADAVQETFYRLIRSCPVFDSDEHEKAWLLRTAANVCKDELKRAHRKNVSINDHTELEGDSEPHVDEVMCEIIKLPDKYKAPVYLYYYEGYTSSEISKILKKPDSTIRNHISEARKLLIKRLGENFI